MLTNTLLLYMTQEALAKARARLTARKDDAPANREPQIQATHPASWQRHDAAKTRPALRH